MMQAPPTVVMLPAQAFRLTAIPALLAARHLARSGLPTGESAPLRMYATTPG
jgi:hypothetical protein